MRSDDGLTRAGVCYDLTRTPYRADALGFTLYFSSLSHKRAFEARLDSKIDWLADSMTRRFRVRMDMAQLACIHHYRQVETRGFRVEDRATGRVYTRPQDMTFSVGVRHG